MRGGALALAVILLAAAGCSGRGGATVSAARTPSSAVVVRGERLQLHAMAYLSQNRVDTPFAVVVHRDDGMDAPTSLTVGVPTMVTVGFDLFSSPVWVQLPPRRETVRARTGTGVLQVATDGCAPEQSLPCRAVPLYAPTGFPIAPMPSPGTETVHGFALHLMTDDLAPGRYDVTLPLSYASDPHQAARLNVADELHVRFDTDTGAATESTCRASDLRAAGPTMTAAPHRIASSFVFADGEDRLDPPRPTDIARINVADAVSALNDGHALSGGGTAVVLLGRYSTAFPRTANGSGQLVPDIHDVLAWVEYTHHIAVYPPHGPPHPNSNISTVPAAPCVFLDGLDAIDATSGKALGSSGYGPGESDPFQP